MRCRGLIALLIWGQSVAAADLGTWGDLWPVKEPDMLTVIMQRLTALEQSGEMGRKMDAFKERVIRNSLRPPAVPGIGRTEKYGSRLFDPSVRLAADTRAAGHTGTRMSRSQQTREPVRPTPTILPVPWCHTSVPFTPKKVPVCMNMPRTPVSQKHPGK